MNKYVKQKFILLSIFKIWRDKKYNINHFNNVVKFI